MTPGRRRLDAWFAGRGWTPFAFQREVWDAWAGGESGLLHVPTGVGKTLAAAGGPLADAVDADAARGENGSPSRGLRLLWITPLRALARDTEVALAEVVDGLGLSWRVERRTGDTSGARKRRQKADPPEILV
ncbi:MAG: DEAD/DEAH box helicase, partial [Longimicrobiales bacterium]